MGAGCLMRAETRRKTRFYFRPQNGMVLQKNPLDLESWLSIPLWGQGGVIGG